MYKQPDSLESTKRFFEIQNAFTGDNTQTGPPVNLSATLLGMSFATRHGPMQAMNMSTCSLLPGCPINIFDSQVTAAVFMLQRIFGVIFTLLSH